LTAYGSRPAGSVSASRARHGRIMAIFAAEPERAFSVREIQQKLMRLESAGDVRKSIGTLRSLGKIETVHYTRIAGGTTYRVAREARSA
jgi:hypothetical protein